MSPKGYYARWRSPMQGEVEMVMQNRPSKKPIGSRWTYSSAAAGYSWDEVGPCVIVGYPDASMERFGRYIVRRDGETIKFYATDSSLTAR